VNDKIYQEIADAETPQKSKKLAVKKTYFEFKRKDWRQIKDRVMLYAL
jgi:predicted NAD-dependent protein-ADP-ribosyltransferase YbiA (DUF1768 family)